MGETPSANEDLYAWHANLRLHCTLFRVLWYGRSGNDALAKTLLKESYALMDVMTDDRKLAKLRANGGILKVGVHTAIRLNTASDHRRAIHLATVDPFEYNTSHDLLGHCSQPSRLPRLRDCEQMSRVATSLATDASSGKGGRYLGS